MLVNQTDQAVNILLDGLQKQECLWNLASRHYEDKGSDQESLDNKDCTFDGGHFVFLQLKGYVAPPGVDGVRYGNAQTILNYLLQTNGMCHPYMGPRAFIRQKVTIMITPDMVAS